MNKCKEIPGVRVGHAQDFEAATGCTVVLIQEGAICGVDQRGGAPSTRQTDSLRPIHLVEQVHAVLLTGGSAFGLAAADGVMHWLEERHIGLDTGVMRVPIVPAAALFDLRIGRADIRPDAAMGYAACDAATEDFSSRAGTVGAGTGATVGGILGMAGRMKGGLGTAVIELVPDLLVGALFAVNCFGDVVNPASGKILAGALKLPEGTFANTLQMLSKMPHSFTGVVSNTVIGVIVTNAELTRGDANKVAQMAHDGLARAVRPAHTMFDGDTIFALSTGKGQIANVNAIGSFAAEASAQAIVNAVQEATSLWDVPALRDLSLHQLHQ
ncbi:L-aminopeptidase/D-esterase [Candidatus Methanoperedens nitroreducens]|uniref:L-aminopeptidase/D-esterase n=1 Tax=Candidatus Methanoperedens nitratireducens TaxID=1392998 RepID=A0A062VBI5_9EURY|nr:P1 family peptidase [Candidatus Methanoperedens nitroreducens]KCZ73049.1 L-aminopeptidase/D-esterase [Candidatus Methanoperedens nitroreducens]MDJ1423006.1 P1 family peptidase [Candidatus Methanoperedens sp.]